MNCLNFSYFPAPPVPPTGRLVPIESWYQMVQETQATGVVFDAFWLDSVLDGVANFFEWRGPVRATVLAIWEPGWLRFVESRTMGDHRLDDVNSAAIECEVGHLFAECGFRALEVVQ